MRTQWQQEHRAELYKYQREWAKKNPDKIRGYVRKYAGIQVGGEIKEGICPLCSQHRKLVPDHNHDSLQLREWLCNTCNLKLGQFETREKDGTHVKFRAYLKKHSKS